LADAIKVTVIATGFDRSLEEPNQLLQQASRQPVETVVPRENLAISSRVPPPRPSSIPASAPAPVYSQRRPAASALHSAPPPSQGSLPQVRDSIKFPGPSDADWDVPAFQRRGVS
jgi:cell division protein FtsZ